MGKENTKDKEKDINMEKDENIEIYSLTDYIEAINNLHNLQKEEGESVNNKISFFRGQADINWEIEPSLYRNGQISNEAEIINEAIRRCPHDFWNIKGFDIISKLQHYGLPTRLLDITTNPLVALYFGCQDCKYKDEENQFGVVYYGTAYPFNSEDIEIKIIALLAQTNLTADYTLDKFYNKLERDSILNGIELAEYKSKNYLQLINVLQSNYVVTPRLNNDRIVRQSGVFLLPGNVNIENETNRLVKANDFFRKEFSKTKFIIPQDKKIEILKELDSININEAMLFPELEHQVEYIKEKYKDRRSIPEAFEKYKAKNTKDKVVEMPTEVFVNINRNESEKILKNAINKYIKQEDLANKCFNSLVDKIVVDWYLKDNYISSMRFRIKTTIYNEKTKNTKFDISMTKKDIAEINRKAQIDSNNISGNIIEEIVLQVDKIKEKQLKEENKCIKKKIMRNA